MLKSKLMRVLIADDSPLFVERVTAVLADLRQVEVVGFAGTVPEAACAVRSLNPDVMILDIEMPGGSGIDVLDGIPRSQMRPVVIVLTNHGSPQYRRKCLERGAHFFLDKAADFEKLPALLHGLNREGSK